MPKKITSIPDENHEWQIDGLTPLQVRAAVLMAQGHPLKSVAKNCGVTVWSIHSWSKNPVFQALVNVYLRDSLNGCRRLTIQAHRKALQRLTQILHDDHATASEVIAACRVILGHPGMGKDEVGSTDPEEIRVRNIQLENLEHIFASLGTN